MGQLQIHLELLVLGAQPADGHGLVTVHQDQDLGLILMLHLKVVPGRHRAQRQQLVETDKGKICIQIIYQ